MTEWKKFLEEEVLTLLATLERGDSQALLKFAEFSAEEKASHVIWFLKTLVERGEFIPQIFLVAKLYSEDSDPHIDGDLNDRIIATEDIRYIHTVRGTNCWLIQALAATFRTEFYSELINVLDRLADDPVLYVRMQATVPLSFFARNIRAERHPDGRVFPFIDEDKRRVVSICFRMLNENRDIPRVLESVTNVFDALRVLRTDEARTVVESLFFNNAHQIQPQYVTHQGVPLLLFFAEFRADVGDDFDPSWFQNFAARMLQFTQEEAPYLRSTFIWHTWKEIQTNPLNYNKFKKYIPLFLGDRLEIQPLGQYDFLVKEVIKAAPQDGVNLYKILLDYVLRWAAEYNIQDHAWLLSTHEVVEEVARNSPEDLLDILQRITQIVSKGIYIGYLETIYKSYTLVKNETDRERLHGAVSELYKTVKEHDRMNKLPEVI